MIVDSHKVCQHGIQYNEQTEFCFHMGCKFERRLRCIKCLKCSMHDHYEDEDDFTYRKIKNPIMLSSIIYQKLCNIEFHILDQNSSLSYLYDSIYYATSLIKNYLFIEKILSDCIMFRSLQIIKILKLQQNNYLEMLIQEMELLVKQYTDKQELEIIQRYDKYQITKAHIGLEHISFLAISPNEKYLLIGSMGYIYLYDISKNLNKKIYRFFHESELAQFSQNSNKIISASDVGIKILNIQTGKSQYLKCKISGDTKYMYVFGNSLYLIQIQSKNHSYLINSIRSLIKFDLISNRQIYSYNLSFVSNQVSFYEDLITYQFYHYLFIINDSTRKTLFKINLEQSQIKKLILLNRYEMLSLQDDRQLIIWNIRFQDNNLKIKNAIQFNATDIFGSNPIFGFIYVILDNTLQIIDKDFNQIYSGQLIANIIEILKWNSNQLNTHKIFIVFQKGIQTNAKIYYRVVMPFKKRKNGLILHIKYKQKLIFFKDCISSNPFKICEPSIRPIFIQRQLTFVQEYTI